MSPGDIVMLTAALRDLHRCYPGNFLTDVRTSCAELWMHNPHVTPLDEFDPAVEVIPCEYPLIHSCNQVPYHCLHGFIDCLNTRLGLQIRPTAFKGDIHLSQEEKAWFSQVHEVAGADIPFWIVVAGGKYDVTIKWWDPQRYQKVVDYFRNRILFVQVGNSGHHHPRLEGVVDLRGRTDLRQLVRLVYHAQGVLCPVTSLMHLAAAVEVKDQAWRHRPCVVVAGGREPVHWEAYPHHQFIHTLGALSCCSDGGCWRSRTVPLGDASHCNRRKRLCVDVVNGLPRCMHMITPEEVIRRVEFYYEGGRLRWLRPAQGNSGNRAILLTRDNYFDEAQLNPQSAGLAAADFLQAMPPYPSTYRGRGIVLCGRENHGALRIGRYVGKLRKLGSALPIEYWHVGTRTVAPGIAAELKSLGVQCRNALEVGHGHGHRARQLNEQELGPYALVNSRFREVLLLGVDRMPSANPERLFSREEFHRFGALIGRMRPWQSHRRRWRWDGIDNQHEPILDIRQVLVDKQRAWNAVRLCLWLNEHSDFFHHRLGGAHELLLFAFRKVGQPFGLIH
jgi:putative component of toxin-antitoxin plasmid stabilization module